MGERNRKKQSKNDRIEALLREQSELYNRLDTVERKLLRELELGRKYVIFPDEDLYLDQRYDKEFIQKHKHAYEYCIRMGMDDDSFNMWARMEDDIGEPLTYDQMVRIVRYLDSHNEDGCIMDPQMHPETIDKLKRLAWPERYL